MSAVAPTDQRRPSGRRWSGIPFTVVVLATMLTAVTLRQGHGQFAGATLLAFTFASWAPLLLRLRLPIAVLVATVTVESLHLIFVPFIEPSLTTPIAVAAYQPVPLATMAAAWTVASRSSRLIGWVAGLGAAGILLLVSLLARPNTLLGTDMVMFNLVCIATGVGVAVSTSTRKKQRIQQHNEQQIREKVTAERLRIARELHDVLAHHLTLVNAQAGIASYLISTNPTAAVTALDGIADHTRSALNELRATVGLLRQEDHQDPAEDDNRQPTPTLEELDTLIDGFRSAGAVVTLQRHGHPQPLAPSADLAAYRIVQEGLTNAMKHAPGSTTDVTMEWAQDQLSLRIENSPSTERPGRIAASGSGNGLIGMRERIQVCGGAMSSEPTTAGGYLVQAHIPISTQADRRPAVPVRSELS